jgi:PhzF family phenazine biosynthesis protein
MQAIASEMNLSETAFFVPRPGTAKRSEYDLRWFISLLEVDLCGHATLASGHFIFKHMQPELEQVAFHTRSGPHGTHALLVSPTWQNAPCSEADLEAWR